ncbi:MAG: cbb3-type cytochrome c oxidase subunit I [Acidimicrobiia bacterium]|nr:cbb3-type cytochrome c oxidase subunit I [Acidimicrobiia bacterium]
MAVTDTRPDTTAEGAPDAPATPRPDPVVAALGSGDHKVVGRLYLVFALVLALAVTFVTTTLGYERIDQSGFDLYATDTYFQVSTLTATSTVFLVLLRCCSASPCTVVPLQIELGASATRPRRRRSGATWSRARWSWPATPSTAVPAGATPWRSTSGSSRSASSSPPCCWRPSACSRRSSSTARRMSLFRVPLFTWSMLVAGAVWLLTLPVLLGALVLAYVDHRYGRLVFGNFDIWFYVHWTLRAPQVYAYAIPAVGIIAEIVAVMGGVRQGRHRVMMALIGFFGAMGVGAYTVTAYTPGHDLYDDWMWIVMGIAVVLPLLGLVGGWADTVRRGRPRLHSSLLFAVVAVLLLLVGAVAGAAAVIEPFELVGTTWQQGQAQLVVFGTFVAALAGIFYWAPKIGGRPLGEGFGRLTALVFFGGVLLLAGGNLAAGFPDQVDHLLVSTQEGFTGVVEVDDTVEIANGASMVGAAVVTLGSFLVLANVLASYLGRRDEDPGDDPWGGHTLEWATASPPPRDNFDEVAMVTSPAPLLDEREPAGDEEEGDDR